jgi:hypothetical protein
MLSGKGAVGLPEFKNRRESFCNFVLISGKNTGRETFADA